MSSPQGGDCSKSFRRSRISEIVGLFESAPRLTNNVAKTSQDGDEGVMTSRIDVKSIINKFDPSHVTSDAFRWHRSATSTSMTTPRRWVQVEKEVDGKVVARMWLRRNSASVDTKKTLKQTSQNVCLTDRQSHSGSGPCDSVRGESRQNECSGEQDLLLPNREAEKQVRASAHRHECPSSRASHFFAFRVDDPETVRRLVAFQDTICKQYPFLSICRTNPSKFHLTLLVLSLRADEVDKAIKAMNKGVSAYRNRIGRAINVELRTVGAFNARLLFVAPSLQQRLLLDALHVELARACSEVGISIVGAGAAWSRWSSKCSHAVQNSTTKSGPNTVHNVQPSGVMTTNPTFSVDSLWSNQKTTYFPCPLPQDNPFYVDEADAVNRPEYQASDDGRDVSVEDLERCAQTVVEDFGETQQSCLTPTALDLILLKKYDISGSRNTLYVPQVSIFKTGKANRRGKRSDQQITKMKVFPRLYHSTVQKILAGALWKPKSDISSRKVITQSHAKIPPFGEQLCNRLELVEMSLADCDGYYKRLFGMDLSDSVAPTAG